LWLEAQSVPSAAAVPCVRSLPVGWTFGKAKVFSGGSIITLNHDRAGSGALRLKLTATCDRTGDTPTTVDSAVAGRFQPQSATPSSITWINVFPGGCVMTELHSKSGITAVDAGLPRQVAEIFSLASRDSLRTALFQRSDGRLHLDKGSTR
jgi:hypothetical protein